MQTPLTSLVRAAATAVAATALLASAEADDAPRLEVRSAFARFDTHPRTAARRDTLRLDVRLRPPDALGAFDPQSDVVRVTVAGAVVFDAAPPAARRAYRRWPRRGAAQRWRLRTRGEPGAAGTGVLTANTRTGVVRLSVRQAGLAALRDAGPDDVDVELTLGLTTASAQFDFFEARTGPRALWRYRNVPPGPRPPRVLGFTSLVAGSLAETPRPATEVVLDDAQLAALWTALGNPSALPQVDFQHEMVVAVSALVVGPGQFPPTLDVETVRDTGTQLRVDWRFLQCEEPGQCPGAPGVPCPTVTPFHVFRTTRTDGGVTLVQGAPLGVCP